jgi:hypothetical protein
VNGYRIKGEGGQIRERERWRRSKGTGMKCIGNKNTKNDKYRGRAKLNTE